MGNADFKHGYALVIGVGKDLPVTELDAQALYGLFIDKNRCSYPTEQVRLLTGSQATRKNILEELDWLATQAKNDTEATVVVYFSGHGGIHHTYFLVPYNYDPGNFSETSISGIELTEKLRAITSKKLLVLLDCCQAAGMAEIKAPILQPAPYPSELQSFLKEGSGRVLLASSRADEVSLTAKPYSEFTLALLEGLSGYGSAKHDGYSRIADVAMYVGYTVPTRTKNRQHPVLNFSQADNFAFAYYAGGEKTPKKLDLSPDMPIPFDPADERYSGQFRAVMHNFADIQSRLFQYDSYGQAPRPLQVDAQRLLDKLNELETKIRLNNAQSKSKDSVIAHGSGAMAIKANGDVSIVRIDGNVIGNIILGNSNAISDTDSQAKSARLPGDATTDAPLPGAKKKKKSRKQENEG